MSLLHPYSVDLITRERQDQFRREAAQHRLMREAADAAKAHASTEPRWSAGRRWTLAIVRRIVIAVGASRAIADRRSRAGLA